jgi:hypothetical protein
VSGVLASLCSCRAPIACARCDCPRQQPHLRRKAAGSPPSCYRLRLMYYPVPARGWRPFGVGPLAVLHAASVSGGVDRNLRSPTIVLAIPFPAVVLGAVRIARYILLKEAPVRRTCDSPIFSNSSLLVIRSATPAHQTSWRAAGRAGGQFDRGTPTRIWALAIAQATMDGPVLRFLPTRLSLLPGLLDEGEHAGDALGGVGSGDMVSVAL